MALSTIPKPSVTADAPIPHNEERRAQAVIKTGLVDAPNSDLFQIYCDLARDLTGFEQAKFSLFDGDSQCSMAGSGVDENYEVGARSDRSKWNVCSYVLLDVEPLIIEDFYKDPDWAEHPYIKSGDAPHAYAGFPVVNKDNYVLGTLCLFNTDPKKISDSQEDLIKRIARNIAHLLDLQVEQKSLTAEKIIKAADVLSSAMKKASLVDFKNLLLLEAGLPIDAVGASQLQSEGFCDISEGVKVTLTAKGRKLIQSMGLTPKPMKRIKVTGTDASELIDKIFEELD
jgi:hypothetical protein